MFIHATEKNRFQAFENKKHYYRIYVDIYT